MILIPIIRGTDSYQYGHGITVIFLPNIFVMTGELNITQINNILNSQVIGRLACTDGKRPYIIPVTYAYDGKYIYGQSNEGSKLDILRKNPSICFEVDVMTDLYNWQSVIISGKFEEIKNTKNQMRAKDVFFNRVFPLATSNVIHHHEHDVTATIDDRTRIKSVLYRIKINKLSGRFERQ